MLLISWCAVGLLLAFWLGCRIGSMDLRAQLVAQDKKIFELQQLVEAFKACYEVERTRRQAMASISAEHPHD